MALDHVNKLLQTNELVIDLKRNVRLREKFKENEEEVLQMYTLTQEELDAIQRRDFKALYDMGVHQYLLAQLARLIYGTADGSNDGGSVAILMKQMLMDEKD
jgi:hypothetical protein